jgi:hypothetical protein
MFIKSNNTVKDFDIIYRVGILSYKIVNNIVFSNIIELIVKKIILFGQMTYENINEIIKNKDVFKPEIKPGMLVNVKTYIILFGYNDDTIYYDIDGSLVMSRALNGTPGLKNIFTNKTILTDGLLNKLVSYITVQTVSIYNCDYDTDKYEEFVPNQYLQPEMKGGKRYNLNNISFYIFIFLMVLVIIIMIISIIPLLHRCLKHHKFVQHNTFHHDM